MVPWATPPTLIVFLFTHACGGTGKQRHQRSIAQDFCSILLFETGSALEPGTHWWAVLTCQSVPGICLSLYPASYRVLKTHATMPGFYEDAQNASSGSLSTGLSPQLPNDFYTYQNKACLWIKIHAVTQNNSQVFCTYFPRGSFLNV